MALRIARNHTLAVLSLAVLRDLDASQGQSFAEGVRKAGRTLNGLKLWGSGKGLQVSFPSLGSCPCGVAGPASHHQRPSS